MLQTGQDIQILKAKSRACKALRKEMKHVFLVEITLLLI